MITHRHQSMLWNASDEAIMHALASASYNKRVAVTGTETNAARWGKLLREGLKDYHVTRNPGLYFRGDPFVAVREDFGPLVKEGVVTLSDHIYDGHKVHMAFQARRKKGSEHIVFFCSIHWPAHVEGDMRDLEGQTRVKAYKNGLSNLNLWVKRQRARFPSAKFIIAADWNLDFKDQWVRELIEKALDGTKLDVLPAKWKEIEGTFGNRLIDWVVTDLNGVGRVKPEIEGLDHKPVTFGFTIPSFEPNATITQKVVTAAKRRGLDVLSRKEWGSVHGDVYAYRRKWKPHKVLPDRPVDTIWQHITVTIDHGELTGDFKADVRTVERIGYERFGSGVSYNWIVDMKTGQIAQGMPLDAKGTHTVNDKEASTPSGEPLSYDQNYVSLAIAVLGMPGTPLSAKAEAAIVQLLKAHQDAGALTEGFDYLPHSHVAYKDCPCDPTRNRMDEIRKAVRDAD